MNWLALALTVPTAILLWAGMLLVVVLREEILFTFMCLAFLLGAYCILAAILGIT